MKSILAYFTAFLIFCAWLHYEKRKSTRAEQKATEEFWALEREANHTRNKDYSDLPILHIEEAEIPRTDRTSSTIEYNIGHIRQIIKNPMVDLSEYSNTDLKLAYGVGNFKTLSEYDENFNAFLIAVTDLARSYEQEKLYEAARDTYLLALRYGSRKVSDYTELAEVYLRLDQPEQITSLIRDTETGLHPRKQTIIRALREVLSSYQ